jgi:hypothetical protein
MAKCFLAQQSLPPEADAEQVEKVGRACAWDKVRLGEGAQFYVNYWKIGAAGLRSAIGRHIAEGRKIFKKFEQQSPGTILDHHLQANVTIYEGKNVYVQMILTGTVFIIVNAHEHTTLTRLPQ